MCGRSGVPMRKYVDENLDGMSSLSSEYVAYEELASHISGHLLLLLRPVLDHIGPVLRGIQSTSVPG